MDDDLAIPREVELGRALGLELSVGKYAQAPGAVSTAADCCGEAAAEYGTDRAREERLASALQGFLAVACELVYASVRGDDDALRRLESLVSKLERDDDRRFRKSGS
jgi:hypothetical protein